MGGGQTKPSTPTDTMEGIVPLNAAVAAKPPRPNRRKASVGATKDTPQPKETPQPAPQKIKKSPPPQNPLQPPTTKHVEKVTPNPMTASAAKHLEKHSEKHKTELMSAPAAAPKGSTPPKSPPRSPVLKPTTPNPSRRRTGTDRSLLEGEGVDTTTTPGGVKGGPKDAAEKQVFRMLMKVCVQLAREQRERVGKFRKDERHCGLELYDIMGLDEDEFIAPPNELQLALSNYRFPPPNMHLMLDSGCDEATLVLMLGPTETQHRKEQGFVVAESRDKTFSTTKDTRLRRVAVSSEGSKDFRTMTTHKVIEKTPEQLARLKGFVSTSVLFRGLDARDVKIVLDAFGLETYKANENVFEQGDEGDKFYLIDRGRCEIILCDSDGTQKQSFFIGEGDTFGELGVMYGTPRAATILAATTVSLWWIDRDTYRSTLLQQTLRKRERYIEFIDRVPILAGLEAYEKVRLADVFEVVEDVQGCVVCHEGDLGDCFYIVEEGTCAVTKRGTQGAVNTLKEGDYFGELALLLDQPRVATVTVTSPTVRLVMLNRKNFVGYLGPMDTILRRNAQTYDRMVAVRQNESAE